MFINLTIPAYTVRKRITYNLDNEQVNLKQFPILVIDKDSYIVGSKIWCNIDSAKDFWGYNLQIGKHSSLAEDIEFIINLNKDYHKVAMGIITDGTASVGYNPEIKYKGQIIIQNDCWVGNDVKIMSGVTIHNGAIVGAGSVVTKDVPAYAIVAGNPAKIVGYRFNEGTIDALQKIAWWDWSAEKIAVNINLLRSEPQLLIDRCLAEAIIELNQYKHRISPVSKMASGKIYSFKVDLDSAYSITNYVIRSFCEKFDNTEEQLVLYVPYENEQREQMINLIYEELNKYDDRTCYVQIIDHADATLRDVIINSDFFITSRDADMVYASCLVDLYGKKMISGVDRPLF